jgi:hypothetical protein
MTDRKPFTLIAAAIFMLVALVHAYRLAAGIPITIGGQAVGQAVSWIGMIVAGGLSAMLVREARR